MGGKLDVVNLMLRQRPLHDNPMAPRGVYLRATARTAFSGDGPRALPAGANITELDDNGDSPLSVFLVQSTRML